MHNQSAHLHHHPITQLPTLPLPAIIVLSVPATVIILLTVFGNLLVLFFKARVGRTNTTLLVWNLGLTDFLVGLFVLPVGAVYLIQRKWIFGRLMCRIWVGADVTFCTCSVVTICVISADRYLAVTRPLRYKSVITKFKIVIVIIFIWSFSLGILLSTVRWDSEWAKETDTCFAGHEIRYLAHSVVFAFFLPASVTLTLYWRIYRLARNRQRALDRGFLMILGRNMNFLTNTLSQTTALRVHVGKNNGMVEHQRRVLRTHERIAKTLGVVSCSFLFCWLPFFTLYLFNYRCDGCVPALMIDMASWLGYCNSMLNPIIYSFTVKEFKRSALCAILPGWKYVYRLCPKYVCKPPDPRASQRMARRKQQIQRQRTKNAKSNTLLLPPQYDFVKRRVPPKERAKGAIASLMVNTNCSIAQNLLTSAAITRDDHKMVTIEHSSSSNGVKKAIVGMNNNNIGNNNNKINEMRQRGRRFTIEENLARIPAIEESDLLNQNGLVTATLLLATSRGYYKDRVEKSEKRVKMEEANSLPPTFSPETGSSDSLSPTERAYRMPCKISVKKLKRHSLPDTTAVLRKQTELEKKQAKGALKDAKFGACQKGVLPQFKKKEAAGNSRKNSPSGLWQRATARAIALRDQFMMSKSSSFGSLSSRKREKLSECAVESGHERREEQQQQVERIVGQQKGWMCQKSFEEEPPGLANGEEKEVPEDVEEEEETMEMDVHIVCLTEEIEL